jgi:UDP-N-acetylglucosamine transferase subunit ALG13
VTSEEPKPLVFATVGTDVHPFDRMTSWLDAWLAAGGAARARAFVQTGTSRKPRLAEHRDYIGYAEMEAAMREATAVICHGGPATISLCSALGKRPIVIPRLADLGEHVDNHQQRFTARIAADGAILLASSEEEFRELLEGVLAANGSAAPAAAAPSDSLAAVRRFEELVAGLFNGNGVAAPPPQPVTAARRRS